MLLTGTLDFHLPAFAWRVFPIFAAVALSVYYLAWKYIVNFFNEVLGIA